MNTENRIYKIKRKVRQAQLRIGTMRCDRCPPHRKENADTRQPFRSWKFRGKKATQYRPKSF